MKDELIIHTDGGARGNPGPAACAFVAEIGDKVFHKSSKYLGSTTNNVAEYQGVLLALKWIIENQSKFESVFQLTFYLDSELIVRQIVGVYKVRDEKLKGLYLTVTELMQKIDKKIVYKNIPRAKNKIADFLVNKELDSTH